MNLKIDTKLLAEFAIRKFEIDKAETIECMAWLVLLNEEVNDEKLGNSEYSFTDYYGNVHTLTQYSIDLACENLNNAIENNSFEDYGVLKEDAPTYINGGEFEELINRCKEKAYSLPVQNPLYAGKITHSFYLYKASYTGHMGIDMGGVGFF